MHIICGNVVITVARIDRADDLRAARDYYDGLHTALLGSPSTAASGNGSSTVLLDGPFGPASRVAPAHQSQPPATG